MKFTWHRLMAVVIKEFVQMRRDQTTFAMIIAIPLIQLLLFGYAINTNPKNLPLVICQADKSVFTRAIVMGMKNTDYFRFLNVVGSKTADRMIRDGDVQFVLRIPPDFTRDLVRGKRPQLLLEADATDPQATAQALSAINVLMTEVLNPYLVGPLRHLRQSPSPVNLVTHAKYNPELITQYNIVPGLMGVVLTMTMVMITALAITRERERGTMESLLATPVRPLEVMVGKVVPYIIVGYIQLALIMLAAIILFNVPLEGSFILLCFATLPFIAANLSVGLMFSTIAKNQLQAVQMTFFFFLPSILLSGFMFPFRGMPMWAQYLGSILPLTHFLRIVRGIMLKGNGFHLTMLQIWPILAFTLVVILLGLKRYRQTLD